MQSSCQLKQPEANSAKGQLHGKESLRDAANYSAQDDSIPERQALRWWILFFLPVSFKGIEGPARAV